MAVAQARTIITVVTVMTWSPTTFAEDGFQPALGSQNVASSETKSSSSSVPSIAPSLAAPGMGPANVPADDPYDGPPTLFRRQPSVGWYVGSGLTYSRMNHDGGVLAGLEASLLLDHELSFGLVGYLWGNETPGPATLDGTPQNLGVFYGGGVIRYAMFTEYIVYPSAGGIVGAGAGTLVPEDGRYVPRSNTDTFFVFEPQIGVHSNVTRWMRLTVHLGYRMAAGASRFGFEDSEYSSLTLGGAVQFGRL